MIDGELARALKVASLPWRPRRGDLCMDRLGVYLPVLADGPNDDGAVQVHDGRVVEWRHVLGLCWLPRTDDLLPALRRYGSVSLSADHGRWCCRVNTIQTEAGSPADAAGKALLTLLNQ